MFVASYRASGGRAGGGGGGRGAGGDGRARVGSGRDSTEGGVRCRAGEGGGDGIDRVKYFTTHFRRCARRVVLGEVGGTVGPARGTEGGQQRKKGKGEKKKGERMEGGKKRRKRNENEKHSTISRDRNPPPPFSPVEYGFPNVYELSGDFTFHN